MERDGNGWVECELGHRHWGLHGAAGLLLHTVDADGSLRVLLQHRADWCHHGGTWGLPGGARDSHETVEEAALREAAEETSIDADPGAPPARLRRRPRWMELHDCLRRQPDSHSRRFPTRSRRRWSGSASTASTPFRSIRASATPGRRYSWLRSLCSWTRPTCSVPLRTVGGRTASARRSGWRLRWPASARAPCMTTTSPVSSRPSTSSSRVPHGTRVFPTPCTSSVHPAPVTTRSLRRSNSWRGSRQRLVVVTSDRELKTRVTAAAADADVRGAKWLLNLL